MKNLYIPGINDEILLDKEVVHLPVFKLIKIMEILFPLDKIYKIEKIVSFNNENYLEDIKDIIKHDFELYNQQIDGEYGYFHITFEKKLHKNKNLNYDPFCPYAISLVVKNDEIEYEKYKNDFKIKTNKFLRK